jgi:uncharacterized protein
MKEEVLEEFTRQFIEAQPDGFPANFAWQGGEPTLLGVDFFRKAVEFQEKYKRPGQEVTNAFQTNAVLIDSEWASFFADNNFLIGVSIDGPKKVHNRYRVDSRGEGTFDRVMEAVGHMKDKGVQYNALTCVNRHTPGNTLDIYRFLREHFEFLQFIPIVEEKEFCEEAPFLENAEKWKNRKARKPESIVHNWCVTPKGFGDFLCGVFDEWVRNDVGRTFVQLFDVSLARWVGQPPGLCVFSPVCGKALVIEHDGSLYSCDHFVYKEYCLGNIMDTDIQELVNSPFQKKFGEDKRNRLTKKCRDCEVLFLCQGACPKNRIITTPGGEPELNYLCEGYQQFFNHTAPYMRTMGDLLRQQRPAADIMAMLKEQDAQKAKPNDPCPCGSGKKFKSCCMKKN